MRTLSEFTGLTRDAAALWWRQLPGLVGWFSLGYAVNELCGHLSTVLGGGQRILGTTIIVVGIVAWVACLVLAVEAFRTPRQGRDSRLDVLAAAMGPFMAVYGAWGLAEEQFDRLIQANLMAHGIDADQFSVNAGDWGFFLAFALAAWLVRLGVRLLGRRWPSRSLVLVGLVGDGAWIFASFFVLREWAGRGFDWLTTRAVWRWVQTGWDGFVALLPDLPIWWGLTLPEGLRLLGLRLWDFVVPGFANAVLLPLIWVALVGTVFGHRDTGVETLLSGTRAEPATRLLRRGRHHPLRRILRLATGELREKYRPMASTLALLSGRGARFAGALLVLVAAVQLAGNLVERAVQHLIRPRPLPETLLYAPTLNYLVALLTTTALLACYTAAYLRADAGVRVRGAARPSAGASESAGRTEDVPPPRTAPASAG